jgi:hypothetical protein
MLLALMAVLFVVGLMNLVWMAAIALIFLAEKNSRHAVTLTKVIGTAVVALGLVIAIQPSVLGTITPDAPAAPSMPGSMMPDSSMMME